MIESRIRIQGDQCVIRLPKGEQQGPKFPLQDGMTVEITPVPGMWISGTYHYDPAHHEHSWCYNESYFVGLIDGMLVRVQS